MKRIGLLGGTFNPPHLGHLKLAELALAALSLDQVRFIPTAAPPHKPQVGPQGAVRLRLLQAALEATGLPFCVSPLELERGGISYTVDTLEALETREPGQAWIFLMGSDQMPGFSSWKRAERILDLAALAVSPRPGAALTHLPALLEGRCRPYWSGCPGELVRLPGTELPLSSHELREDLGLGKRPEGIPPEVMTAILRENQYR